MGQKRQTSLRTRREHEATRRAQKVGLQSRYVCPHDSTSSGVPPCKQWPLRPVTTDSVLHVPSYQIDLPSQNELSRRRCRRCLTQWRASMAKREDAAHCKRIFGRAAPPRHFLDALKSPDQHLSVGSKIIPIASQKVQNRQRF